MFWNWSISFIICMHIKRKHLCLKINFLLLAKELQYFAFHILKKTWKKKSINIIQKKIVFKNVFAFVQKRINILSVKTTFIRPNKLNSWLHLLFSNDKKCKIEIIGCFLQLLKILPWKKKGLTVLVSEAQTARACPAGCFLCDPPPTIPPPQSRLLLGVWVASYIHLHQKKRRKSLSLLLCGMKSSSSQGVKRGEEIMGALHIIYPDTGRGCGERVRGVGGVTPSSSP